MHHKVGRVCEVAVSAVSIVLLIAVIAVCWLRGIPAFQHDWSWPFTRSQAFQEAMGALHIWHPEGLGTVATAPNGALVTILMFGTAAIVGPLNALHVFDVIAVVLSAAGMFLFARSHDAKCSAIVASAIFCTSPVIYNKLFAGHTYYLAGAAVLPWLGYTAIEALKRERFFFSYTVACGVLLGVAASQFQFILIGSILLVAAAAAQPSTLMRKFALVAIAMVIALLLHAADYRVMLQPQTGGALASQVATPQWEVSQSVPLVKSLAQFDYIGGYARRALGGFADGAAELAAAGILICALSAVVVRKKNAGLGLALLIVGWFVSAGTYGPLAFPMLQAFEHNGIATAFRELYNFSILTALGCALLVAQVAAAGRNKVRIASAALSCIVALLLALPFIASPPVSKMVAVSQEHAAAIVRQTSDVHGRVLLLPGGPALSYKADAFHGVDSDGQPWDNASAIAYTSAPDQYAFLFSREPTQQLFARLGIVKVIERGDVRDAYFDYLDPHSATIARSLRESSPHKIQTLHALSASGDDRFTNVLMTRRVLAGEPLWSTVNALRPEEHLISDAPQAVLPTSSNVRIGVDPLTDWSQSARWLPAIPQLSCLPEPSLFRLHGAAAPSGCNWHKGQFNGRSCLVDDAGALQAISLSCVYQTSHASAHEPASAVAMRVARDDELIAYIRTAFDGRWQLRCGSNPVISRPVLVDAYAMGWVVRSDAVRCSSRFTAQFAGDAQFANTLFASWIVAALLLLAAMLYERKGSVPLRDR